MILKSKVAFVAFVAFKTLDKFFFRTRQPAARIVFSGTRSAESCGDYTHYRYSWGEESQPPVFGFLVLPQPSTALAAAEVADRSKSKGQKKGRPSSANLPTNRPPPKTWWTWTRPPTYRSPGFTSRPADLPTADLADPEDPGPGPEDLAARRRPIRQLPALVGEPSFNHFAIITTTYPQISPAWPGNLKTLCQLLSII